MTNRNVRTFARRELFDLVWSKPIQKIAEELGISDRGLAKICIRHRVPNPSRGYWARVAAGQKIRPPLYRDLDDASLDRIEITATVPDFPDETHETIRKARADRIEQQKLPGTERANPTFPIEKPHRIVSMTGRELRKAMPDRYEVFLIQEQACAASSRT